MQNYYCLISGLPDLQLDNSKNTPSIEEIDGWFEEELTYDDLSLLRLFQMQYDNKNLLTYLNDKNADLDPKGTLTTADFDEIVPELDAAESPKDSRIHPYMMEYYQNINDEKTASTISSKEDYITTLYYEYGSKNKNKFASDWFTLNLNLNNLLTAVSCRKFGFDLKTAIIGNNDIAEAIRTSNARDFGLNGMYDDLDEVLAIAEQPNLYEREKQLDLFKWNWLEEHTFFNYFTVEKVLAFYVRCQIIHRWDHLNIDEGKSILKDMLGELKKEVVF